MAVDIIGTLIADDFPLAVGSDAGVALNEGVGFNVAKFRLILPDLYRFPTIAPDWRNIFKTIAAYYIP